MRCGLSLLSFRGTAWRWRSTLTVRWDIMSSTSPLPPSCAAKHFARRMAGASVRVWTQALTCTWTRASSTSTATRRPGALASTSAATSTTTTSSTWSRSSPVSVTRDGQVFTARCPRLHLVLLLHRFSPPFLCLTPGRAACWEMSCSFCPSISPVCASSCSWDCVWLSSVWYCRRRGFLLGQTTDSL